MQHIMPSEYEAWVRATTPPSAAQLREHHELLRLKRLQADKATLRRAKQVLANYHAAKPPKPSTPPTPREVFTSDECYLPPPPRTSAGQQAYADYMNAIAQASSPPDPVVAGFAAGATRTPSGPRKVTTSPWFHK